MAEDDIRQLIKRFTELCDRAQNNYSYTHSRFLNLAEQAVLSSIRPKLDYFLDGGYPRAERRIAVFGNEELTGAPFQSPIECVLIRPAGAKFSEELTHRDYLGALMALGMSREMLGDIVVSGGCGYLFCLDTAARFVVENLTEVRRTAVRCQSGALPEGAASSGEERTVVVASERLDALISAVYKLSREDAKQLCEKGLVYIDSALVQKGGATIQKGSIVSVRGKGRFVYLGSVLTTKKGKLRVRVCVF